MNTVKCPVCDGTGKVPIPENEKFYSWNKNKDYQECSNCGGQTMRGIGTGLVRVNPNTNEGCIHKYRGVTIGRCFHQYTCEYCGDSYQIDSGD